MTRVLVRLKVRLLLNRSRSTRGGRSALWAGAAMAAVLSVVGFTVALGLGRSQDPRIDRTSAVLGATVLLVAWAVLPLLTFGNDESLEPARLASFPLRRRSLMRGLLAASLIGFAPAAAIATVAGAIVARAGGTGLVVGIPAMVLLVVLCAVTSRALTTSLAGGLTSRRGRDGAVVVMSLLLVAVQGVRFIHFSALEPAAFARLDDLLRWLPPGMLGQALIDSSRGRVLVAIVELVPAAAAIVALLVLWERALDRSLTVAAAAGAARRRQRHRTALPLLFRRLALVAPTPWGAVTAKELRYMVREPRRKVSLVNSVLVGAALPIFFAARSSGSFRSLSVLLASLAGYIVVLSAMNQFGPDGAALWLDVVAGDKVRAELVGKNIALLILVVPMVAGVGLVTAAVTGGWVYLPVALLLALAGLGAGLGVANVVSVRFPIRLPDTRSPFGGYGAGQGCTTVIIVFGCSLMQNLLIAPVVAAATITATVAPAALVVVAPLCAVYGAALWWAGLNIATQWARGHQPELLRAVDPGRSD